MVEENNRIWIHVCDPWYRAKGNETWWEVSIGYSAGYDGFVIGIIGISGH